MFFSIVYQLALLITVIKSAILGREQSFSAQNFLFIYLFISLIIEFYAFATFFINPDCKIGLLYNIYFMVILLFFYFFYSRELIEYQKKISLFIFIIALVYILFFSGFYLENFDPKVGVSFALFCVINSILWFLQILNQVNEKKIQDNPYFWISSGLLLWSVLFIFRVIPMYLFDAADKEFLSFLKLILNIVNIILYTIFYIALLKFEKLKIV